MSQNLHSPTSVYPTNHQLPAIEPVHAHLGPYELVGKLGSGGMGIVYIATRKFEEESRRTVVIKTLRDELQARPTLVRMFLDEARISARIVHPFVCRVLDVGISDNVPFVAMEYLVGEPLSRIIPLLSSVRSETAIACAVKIVADLCEGLHAAHELRDAEGQALHVVHRDISPDNLFVLYDGSVRVMDFGIATTADVRKVENRSLAGKWGYMSPEQLRGEPIDRRADIWAMGVVLWEFLTGRRLFHRSSDVRSAVAVLSDVVPAPSTINPYVPKNLDNVVMRALAREVNGRLSTARELGHALETVLFTALRPVSAAKLAAWLTELFPGREEFWHRIVPHTRELFEQSGPRAVPHELRGGTSLEFDPLLIVPAHPAPLAPVPSAASQQTSSSRRRYVWAVPAVLALALPMVLSQRAEPIRSAPKRPFPPSSHKLPLHAAPRSALDAAVTAVIQDASAREAPSASTSLPNAGKSTAHNVSHEARPHSATGSVYFATRQKNLTIMVAGQSFQAPGQMALPAGENEVVVRVDNQVRSIAKVTVVSGKSLIFDLDSAL